MTDFKYGIGEQTNYFAYCDSCDWSAIDRDNEEAAAMDLQEHMAANHEGFSDD